MSRKPISRNYRFVLYINVFTITRFGFHGFYFFNSNLIEQMMLRGFLIEDFIFYQTKKEYGRALAKVQFLLNDEIIFFAIE